MYNYREMDYKYYPSLDGVTLDLSNQSLVDLTTPPVNIGKNVYINADGTHVFISSGKSINSTYNGDVFVYVYDSSTKTWSYQTSFYNLVHTASNLFQSHEGNTGANPANFGKIVITNDDATIAYIGIPGFRQSNLDCGAVAIVERTNTTWSFVDFIINRNSSGNAIQAHQGFGSALAFGGSSLFVGTSTNYNYSNAGVFLYSISGTTYTKDHNFDIKPDVLETTATANFGTSLACSSDGLRLFVGSDYYAQHVDSTNYYTGDVHIFYYNSSNSSWVLIQTCYDIIKNSVPTAAVHNGSSIGKQISINSTGSKLLISTNLTNLNNKYGMVFYLEYQISGATESYVFKQYLRSPVSNSLSKPFGESLSMSKNGNYAAIGTLDINVNLYHFDSVSYWQENETISQSIIDDISSNEYAKPSILDKYANSLCLSSDGKMMALGISEYRYNNPTTISGLVSGQAFVYFAKGLQTITSFEDLDHGYDVTVSLTSASNGSGNPSYYDPEASTMTNTIYQFVMNATKVKIIGIGPKALGVQYPEDETYVETQKIVQVIGRPVDQYIDYTDAISTQGFIGIGQTSGLIFEVRNAESQGLSKLAASMTITGDSVIYDPVKKEIEGVKLGISTVTLSQPGDAYYNAVAAPITLTYDVSNNWSGAYPGQYNPGYTPTEGGMTFGDQDGLDISPLDNTIGEKIGFGLSKKDAIETTTYSIPLLEKERTNDLKRTMLKRDVGTFKMEIKDVSGVDYMAVSLHDISKLGLFYDKLSGEDGSRIVELENKTDFFQIEKYKAVGGDYVKNTTDYVSLRLYHPHDSLVVYHIDEAGTTMTEVTTDNFPESSILREHSTSDYWYVKMPFSTGIGGTESVPNGVVCFRKHSIVECDQGPVEIQDIDITYHTIQNRPIISVTRSRNLEGKILYIPKDTFKKNYPNRDTYISFLHKIKHSGIFTRAIDLYSLYPEQIEIMNYQGDLYNILLGGHHSVCINGLTVETLYPNDDVAKLYRNIIANRKYSAMNKRDMIQLYNKKHRKHSF